MVVAVVGSSLVVEDIVGSSLAVEDTLVEGSLVVEDTHRSPEEDLVDSLAGIHRKPFGYPKVSAVASIAVVAAVGIVLRMSSLLVSVPEVRMLEGGRRHRQTSCHWELPIAISWLLDQHKSMSCISRRTWPPNRQAQRVGSWDRLCSLE